VEFDLALAKDVLNRTPATLTALLRGLDDEWTTANEGGETWSAFDVVGHLIHGEKTDWMPRVRHLLEHGERRPFEPFDRFAQFEASKGKPLDLLLDEFAALRAASLKDLDDFGLVPEQMSLKGLHPALGAVTLSQLLSTWVAHDLDHLSQISRVLAKGYADAVGPWRAYLKVLS
jgi:hypothetical protein